MPISKSFIQRDLVSKPKDSSVSAVDAYDKHRRELLTRLEQQLSDEKNLIRDSVDYSRTSGPPALNEASVTRTQRASVSPKRQRSERAMDSTKRRRVGGDVSSSLLLLWFTQDPLIPTVAPYLTIQYSAKGFADRLHSVLAAKGL